MCNTSLSGRGSEGDTVSPPREVPPHADGLAPLAGGARHDSSVACVACDIAK